jgi:ABC-2 type transport system permease protein
VAGYLLQGLWALPIYAWVMLVSVWARRGPILWCIGVPVVAATLERILFQTDLLSSAIWRHLQLAALPRGGRGMNAQLELLGRADFWLGVLVGLVLLAVAVWFRQRNNEI